MLVAKDKKPRVVLIGGGTGASVVLKSLKDFDVNITAIVSVADNGGSSGKLRSENGQVPPGDIRNVMTALSSLDQEFLDLFQYRYDKSNPNLGGHVLGNLVIAAMSEMQGDVYTAIQKLSQMMKIQGKVLPSSERALNLNCVFTDGARVTGEAQIPLYHKEIERIYVTAGQMGEPVQAGPGVIGAIEAADLIVLGPGSLYTSLLPNLVIPEIGQAVVKASAKVLYICNIIEQKGETEGFSDADHIKVLHQHLGQSFVDAVLVNIGEVGSDYMEAAGQDQNLRQVRHDYPALTAEVPLVISDNFLDLRDQGVYHNGNKVAREIVKMAKDHYTVKQTLHI